MAEATFRSGTRTVVVGVETTRTGRFTPVITLLYDASEDACRRSMEETFPTRMQALHHGVERAKRWYPPCGSATPPRT